MNRKKAWCSVSSRRSFLTALAGILGAKRLAIAAPKKPAAEARAFFKTRGVVLVPQDLTLADWPQRAAKARLTTIGLHSSSPQAVVDFIRSDPGQTFLESCRRLQLNVEYELHAMSELLPRKLFEIDQTYFRMNKKGERTADANLCTHSQRALEIAAENAVALARTLRPTTNRYFFWGDDAKPWCRCPNCGSLSDSDQALIFENYLLNALRKFKPNAQLGHLAYSHTLPAPKQITPKPNIFLEFAPLDMRHGHPKAKFTDPVNRTYLQALDANVKIFGAANAQALEYWLDASMYSNWKKPAQKLAFNEEAFAADLTLYASRGIRHVTTFAVYIDADYVARYGWPLEVERYGNKLVDHPAR